MRWGRRPQAKYGFSPSPTPTPTPTPTAFYGVDFRATQALVTDPANCIWGGATQQYSGSVNDAHGIKCGWSFTSPAMADNGTTYPRLAGASNINTSIDWYHDLPNGTYNIRLAQGLDSIAAPSGIQIYRRSDNTVLLTVNSSGNIATNSVLDVDGTVRTRAAWDAAPGTVSLVVTGGAGIGIKLGSSPMRMCHFAYEA